MSFLLKSAALLASLALIPSTALAANETDRAKDRCRTATCEKRVAEKQRQKAREACRSRSCKRRVAKRATLAKWRRTVAPHAGWLAGVRQCESGHYGTYRLSTTGNGFWFAYQFTPTTWASVGGRIAGRRPVGLWATHPTALEQDYRAVRVLYTQGRGAWPNCG